MIEAISQTLPLILVFFAAFALKKVKFLSSNDGSTLLKVVFYLGAPALIFQSISHVELDSNTALLGILPAVVIVAGLLATMLVRKTALTSLSTKTFGALLLGAVIMNTGFLIPFVENLYGAEGVARLSIIDAFNGVVVFTLVYAIAVRMGNDKPDGKFIAKKLLLTPPIWALILALVVKLLDLTPPVAITDSLSLVARMVSPLVLIAVGLKFTPKIKKPALLAVPIILRLGLGYLVGFLFVKIFGIQGISAEIAILAAMAPIGFNSVTFSEMENLDEEFAASQLSISILLAILLMPVAFHFIPRLIAG